MSDMRASIILELVEKVRGPARRARDALREIAAESKEVQKIRADANAFAPMAAKIIAAKTAVAALTAAVAGLVPVLASAGAAGAMAFGTILSTASVASMSKEMQKLSETTNVSSQALQEWRLAGRFEGVAADMGEMGDMGKVFADINASLGTIGTKEGKAFVETLNGIGLSAAKVKAMRPDEALLAIGKAVEASKLTESQKATVLASISDDAAKLLPLLKNNLESFAEIRDYAGSVGAFQTPEELTRMKQTSRELSFWKVGLEGVMTRLAQVGGNVVNRLGPNVRQLFVDAQQPIKDWAVAVDDALAQFKADVDDMGWAVAFQRQIQESYPTLYGFIAGAGAFGKGYGEAFISPMLDSLTGAYQRIGAAIGSGDGIEAAGKSLGEMMRPMTGIIDEVSKSVAFLIENFRFMKTVFDFTPLGVAVSFLPEIRSGLDSVGNALKTVGQALGLIDPNSQASGFTVLLSALMALSAAAFANKLALGAVGGVFKFVKFAMSPLVTGVKLLSTGFSLLRAGGGIAFRAMQVAALGIRMLGAAMLANPIGLVIAGIAAAALAGYYIWKNWDTIGPRLKSGFTGAFDAISGRMRGWVAEIKENPAKIITFFATLPIRLAQLGLDAINGFVKGVWGIDLYAEASKLVDRLTAPIRSLNLADLGSNLIQGLINGIMSKAAAVGEAISAIASKVKNVFTTETDQHSPSRIFHSYGGFLPLGAALGIIDQADAPVNAMRDVAARVKGAFGNAANDDTAYFKHPLAATVLAGVVGAGAAMPLAAAPALPELHGSAAYQMAGIQPPLMPSVQQVATLASPIPSVVYPASQQAGVAGGSTNITITINAAPGQSPDAIARAVAAELDRRERQKGVQRRGALHDGANR